MDYSDKIIIEYMYDILQNTTKSQWYNCISILIGGINWFTGSLLVSEIELSHNQKKNV